MFIVKIEVLKHTEQWQMMPQLDMDYQFSYTQIMVSNNNNSKMKLGCQVCLA